MLMAIKIWFSYFLLTKVCVTVMAIIFFGCNFLSAQSNSWNIRGYLGGGADIYKVKGVENRRSPYSYYARGGFTASYKNFSVPVSLAYSNQQFSYGYALNRIGLRPTYKWAKAHIGWSSMQFSPYVMSRKQFLGGGVELTPGKFKLAGFYGTMQNPKAVQDTILYGAVLLPSFKRIATGLKIGYGTGKNHFDLMVFNAQDDQLKVINPNTQTVTVLPEDNLVIGTKFRITPFRSFYIESNIAISGLTKDKNSEAIDFEQSKLINPFLSPTRSTQASLAGNIKTRLLLKGQAIGLEYKRIEPSFRSLGVPYLQTDIQSYLGYVNLNMLKSKVLLQLQGGYQTNNLRNTRAVQTNRLISNIQLNWRATKQLNINARYSNFTNDTEPGAIELSDTLRFTMVSEQAGFNIRYTSPKKENKWNTNLNINRQTIQDLSPIQRIAGDIENWQFSYSFGKKWDGPKANLKITALFATFDGAYQDQQRYGGGIGGGKSFFEEKLTIKLDGRYFRNDIGAFSNGSVVTINSRIGYKILAKQSINLRVVYIDKNSIASRSFQELRAGLSYQVTF